MFTQTPSVSAAQQRIVLAAVVLGSLAVAVISTKTHEVAERVVVPVADVGDAPVALSYSGLRERATPAGSDWQARFATWPTESESQSEPGDRAGVRAARARGRAYDGAPPTVPHPIDPRSSASCDTCHAAGLRLSATVVAPARSHGPYPSCTQCHAPASPRAFGSNAWDEAASTFVGVESHAGERAWQGAPPTIPHDALMRGTCLSCHGPLGPTALRTTHPERTSCRQCHVTQEQR